MSPSLLVGPLNSLKARSWYVDEILKALVDRYKINFLWVLVNVVFKKYKNINAEILIINKLNYSI